MGTAALPFLACQTISMTRSLGSSGRPGRPSSSQAVFAPWDSNVETRERLPGTGNGTWYAVPVPYLDYTIMVYKQLRGCTVHLRPLTPYLTTLIIRTVPYMMPAPLGPNHALDSCGIRVQAEQASRRELPGGMGGGEVCRAMSSTAWTPPRSGPPSMGILGWSPSWGGPGCGGHGSAGLTSPHPPRQSARDPPRIHRGTGADRRVGWIYFSSGSLSLADRAVGTAIPLRSGSVGG